MNSSKLFFNNFVFPHNLLRIVDIGAHPIDGDAPYKELLNLELASLVGFEPQIDGLKILQDKANSNEMYLPYVIGDGNSVLFHECRYPGWSSTLKPSPKFLEIFPAYASNASITNTQEYSTYKLDDVKEVDHIDFLKIDIQGGELKVLQNGLNKLNKCCMIQIEVSFISLYENSPSFTEIDNFMRKIGFTIHCFKDLKNAMISPFVYSDDPFRGINQIIQADAVYIKDLYKQDEFDTDQLKKLSILAHYVIKSYDLVGFCLNELLKRNEICQDDIDKYLEILKWI